MTAPMQGASRLPLSPVGTRSIAELLALAAGLLADPELSENHKAVVRAGVERLEALESDEL